MYFMLDENVPQDVADMLNGQGHKAEFIRDYVPPGSPDPVVATVSQELEAILLSFDGDFEVISPRIPKGNESAFESSAGFGCVVENPKETSECPCLRRG